MRRLAYLRLAALVAAAAVPVSARAGDDIPTSRSSAASTHHVFGHAKAKGHVCAKCAAAKAAQDGQVMQTAAPGQIPSMPGGMEPGSQIVGCAHSTNGVCAPCRKLLEMPGEVTMVRPGVGTAPISPELSMASHGPAGRAVATDAAPGRATIVSGEPEPVGVMKTNYNPNVAPAGMAMPAGRMKPGAGAAPPAMPAGPNRAPFLPETREGNPHILGHLFGFSAMGRDMRDMREMKTRRKRETHAATAYGPNDGRVEELPASMVYGKTDH